MSEDDDCKLLTKYKRRNNHNNNNPSNSKGLLEIAVRTVQLIHRNKLLQAKLAQLQAETHAFITSVMSNPENQALREQIETNKTAKN